MTVLGGAWLTVATFADDADVIQFVTVRQTDEDATAEDLVVTVELPSVPPLAAPVITSPAAGEVVTGDRVTFRGTGQPGAFIGLLVVPTSLAQDLLDELAASADDSPVGEAEVMALAAAPAAAPEPANPADPIPVAADGTWSVTLALPAENYTAIAIQALNAEGTVGLSAPSAPVAFSLQPAPVAVPAGTGTTGTPAASGPSRTLAATGGEDISGLAGIGILALIAGAAAIVVGNRRRVTT
ncbi:LPXTG cell wall anchor domain-containing protein [Microbacterium radiodurans]|uniref:LPXTG cell wall anchor domain-containing protein n=1 Tax=Microbacterium radiodurans TaxID=661398 RepID=UPI00168BB62F|nr:LPXTG cell wall anchor domain-containing protein [Microbacterium radiodurans]